MMSSSYKEKVMLPSYEEMMKKTIEQGNRRASMDDKSSGAPEHIVNAIAEDTIGKADCEAKRMLSEAREQCEQMIREATESVNKMIAEAEGEAAVIKLHAERDIREECRMEMEEEKAKQWDTVHMAAAAFQKSQVALYDALFPEFLDTALAIAESILHHTLDADDVAYISMVQNALDKLFSAKKLELHLPKGRYISLSKNSEGYLRGLSERDVNILVDDTLSETECLVKSSAGSVRAGVDVQMAHMKSALQGAEGEQGV